MVHSPTAQVSLHFKVSLTSFVDFFLSDCGGPPGEIANNASVPMSNGVRTVVTTVSGLSKSVLFCYIVLK